MMMVVPLLFSWQTIGGGIRIDGRSKKQKWRPFSGLKRLCGDSVRKLTTTMMHQRFTTTPRTGGAVQQQEAHRGEMDHRRRRGEWQT
jgi:hypothetical protein